jgi:hypothetical protein
VALQGSPTPPETLIVGGLPPDRVRPRECGRSKTRRKQHPPSEFSAFLDDDLEGADERLRLASNPVPQRGERLARDTERKEAEAYPEGQPNGRGGILRHLPKNEEHESKQGKEDHWSGGVCERIGKAELRVRPLTKRLVQLDRVVQ